MEPRQNAEAGADKRGSASDAPSLAEKHPAPGVLPTAWPVSQKVLKVMGEGVRLLCAPQVIIQKGSPQTKTKAHFYLTCFAQIEGKMCYLLLVSENVYVLFSKQ